MLCLLTLMGIPAAGTAEVTSAASKPADNAATLDTQNTAVAAAGPMVTEVRAPHTKTELASDAAGGFHNINANASNSAVESKPGKPTLLQYRCRLIMCSWRTITL